MSGPALSSIKVTTNSASASQCLGCGRCRPARTWAAEGSETPSAEERTAMATAASLGLDLPNLVVFSEPHWLG